MRRLGLDIGTNSIGWCLVDFDEDREGGTAIIGIGARIFSDGRAPPKSGPVGKPLAEGRRLARGARRRRDRYIGRRSAFLEALIRYGLMPADANEAKLVAAGTHDRWRDVGGKLPAALPYDLRVRALTERLESFEIGRALFHLNQRRGFLSNRKAERRAKDNEEGKIAGGAKALDQEMAEVGADTLGQFLADRIRDQKAARVRMDSEAQAYDFYPQRRHIDFEFRQIWDRQAQYHPGVMTQSALSWDELKAKAAARDKSWRPQEARDALYRILFFQRPLAEAKVGVCTFKNEEHRLPKAHPLFQERRLYEEVNQLEITAPGERPRKLTLDQRNKLVMMLREKKEIAFTTLASGKGLNLQSGDSFNKASATRTHLRGDEVFAAMIHPKRFGDSWRHKAPEEQWRIVERLLDEENPDRLHVFLTQECGLNEEHARATAKAALPEGHGRLGETATRLILAELKKDVITYDEGVRRAGWHHSDERTGEVLDRLPYYGELLSRDIPPGSQRASDPPEKRWGKITNPTVHIGLRQLEKVVNAVIAVHGRPDQIVVELARELKLNDVERDKENKRIRADTAEAQRRSRTLLGQAPDGSVIGNPLAADTGANRAKLKLWEELSGDPVDRFCPYCGRPINMTALFSDYVQVDHIIPYSRSMDDGSSNKVVAHRSCNQEKGKATPYERWSDDPERWGRITEQVSRLHKNKQWRFGPDAMARVEKDGGFLARQLTDTQYLSRLAGKYLRSLYPTKEDGRVYVIPGRMTAMLRRLWALNDVLKDSKFVENKNSNAPKNRLDHRHHAIDAFVCAVTTQSLLMKIAQAAGRAEDKALDRLFEGLPEPWPGYLPQLGKALAAVTISHKPDHGRQGKPDKRHDITTDKLHDDTAYGIVGDLQPGKAPLVVKRVNFLELKPKDIEAPDRIRDEFLRKELQEATRGKNGVAFKEALKRFKNSHAQFGGIRHVRVYGESAGKPTLNVIPMTDASGKVYKSYKGNANALFTVWQLPSGRWVPEIVSVFRINQAGYEERRPHPAAKKVLSLRQDDLIAVERDGRPRQIMRVQKFGQNGQISLVEHNEAGEVDKRHLDPADHFKTWEPAAGSLKTHKARQVRVDPLGRIFDPGPR